MRKAMIPLFLISSSVFIFSKRARPCLLSNGLSALSSGVGSVEDLFVKSLVLL